jgi:hypothetical protein
MPSGARPSGTGERGTGVLRALGTLASHEVRFVLIGGQAAVARGSPLLTRDVDICYARDHDNLERLAAALRELNARLRGAPPDLLFQLDASTLKRGDFFTFDTAVGPLDIMGTPTGTGGFRDLDEAAEDMDLGGFTVRVASLQDLMRMKRAAGRTKDRLALEWLGALRDELEGGSGTT